MTMAKLSLLLPVLSLCCPIASSLSVSRRNVLIGATVPLMGPIVDAADAADDNNAPIAVLGASGRTGAQCVAACLERGIPVRALTRSGTWQQPELSFQMSPNAELLTVAACNVKDASALANGVQGCRGVIYAASASKKGGDAKEIDNIGVLLAAKASIDAKVGRYVVVSSTATTRPKSMGYIFTNVLGGIMDEKRKGEVGARSLFDGSSSCSYTIIRPGGLEEPKENVVLGPSTLEISQGDVLAGIVSRADLAQVCVELAASTQLNLKNTALELYYTDSVQPCEGRFKQLLKSGEAPRLHGQTYEELFRGVMPNIDYANI